VCFEVTFERVKWWRYFNGGRYRIPDLRSSRGKSTTSEIGFYMQLNWQTYLRFFSSSRLSAVSMMNNSKSNYSFKFIWRNCVVAFHFHNQLCINNQWFTVGSESETTKIILQKATTKITTVMAGVFITELFK